MLRHDGAPEAILWTDDFSNLASVLSSQSGTEFIFEWLLHYLRRGVESRVDGGGAPPTPPGALDGSPAGEAPSRLDLPVLDQLRSKHVAQFDEVRKLLALVRGHRLEDGAVLLARR